MCNLRSFLPIAGAAVLALAALPAPASTPWHGGPGGFHGAPGGVYGPHYYGGWGGPRGYVGYPYRGSTWYLGGGTWYRPWRGGYAAFYPPVGLYLSMLPLGYTTLWYSGMPYYYYEDVYYTDAPMGGYLVASPPPATGDPQVPAQPRTGGQPPEETAPDALMIIPKEGQKEDKMVADRQQARRYAMDKSGYDPQRSDPSDPGTPRARQAYLKALKSYLEDRGYSVK